MAEEFISIGESLSGKAPEAKPPTEVVADTPVTFDNAFENSMKEANPEFRFYCIFEGNYTEMKDDSISWENRFGVNAETI